ncbi:MAG: discoidin domain-containing protein [Bacteroidaceae bacterium]|nr:discoidin domain-containing protein [Bacteroidaceae bacterium]
MRKFTLIFSMLFMFMAAAMAESITVTIDRNSGTFTQGNAAGTWNSVWESSEVPGFTFSVSANNISVSDEHDNLRLWVGTVSPSQYVMTAPHGYYVASYSFDFVKDGEYTDDVTLTVDGKDYVPAYDVQSVAVEGLKETSASFIFAGANKGIIVSNFKVVLEEATLATIVYNYVLDGEVVATESFDANMGANLPSPTLTAYGVTFNNLPEGLVEGDATYEITCSYDNSIVFSKDYASVSRWYYMTIHSGNKWYLGYEEGQEYIPAGNAAAGAVQKIPEGKEDNYTWAFVGNPFKFQIVNMAAGENRVLASGDPLGDDGHTYPLLYDVNEDLPYLEGYVSDWYAKKSNQVETGVYIYQHGTTYAMNTRSPALAFWTGGADAGSTILLTVRDTEAVSDATIAALEEAIVDTEALIYDEAGYEEYGGVPFELQTTDPEADFYLYTNAQEASEGPIADLLDGNNATFFHTRWSDNGASDDGMPHSITIDLGGNSISAFGFNYVTRSGAANDYPAEISVQGSNDGVEFEEIAYVTGLPAGSGKSYSSEPIEAQQDYSYLRFEVTKTSTDRKGAGADHDYWHMAEFRLTTAFYRSVAFDAYIPFIDQLQALNDLYKQAQAVLADPEATELLVQDITARLIEQTALLRELISTADNPETVALVAQANEMLALVGVGYPNEAPRAALKEVLDVVAAAPTLANKAILEEALAAYAASTDVQMPEIGKKYCFTMVAKNGNKFYLNYTDNARTGEGKDVAMIPVDGVAYPETAAFEFELSELEILGEDSVTVERIDSAYSIKTIDGNYLVYHSKYSGVDWLAGNGNVVGFQAEKDRMTHIKFEKLVPSSYVVATPVDIFGYIAWKSVRGVRTSNGAWETGYMVLKTDGSDYDGATAPFWNDGYSSALLIEEYVAGETAIEEVKNEVVVEGIYDLSGRRVENPVKGVYIVNGKKVLVK